MNIDENGAKLAFRNAYRALKRGDRASARSWAFRSVALWPEYEEPWLILAAIASPRASAAYLERVLLIHPDSPRAIAGMRWAQQRIQTGQGMQVQRLEPLPQDNSRPGVSPARSTPVQPKLLTRRLAVFATLVVIISMILLAAAILPGGSHGSSAAQALQPSTTATTARTTAVVNTPTPAQPSPTSSSTPPLEIIRPTFTVTSQPTETAVLTFTPDPTQTAVFTATPLPTSTQLPAPPSKTPIPPASTYIVRRGDTLSKIAASYGVNVQSLAQVNNILNPSVIRAGQKLTIPGSGSSIPAQAVTGQKKIVVDLSEQHLYAYQDNELVFSFVVSTGRGNGTAAGNFSILDKDPNAWSDPWGFWMPYWLGIYYVGSNLENGIHSLPVLTNGAQIWGDSIGTPVSYGCVVLLPDDARQLFNWVNIGTPVQIKY
jgi:LysM repeat protein